MESSNEELRELAAVLNGIADGEEWEIRNIVNWTLAEDQDPLEMLACGYQIRLRVRPLPQPDIRTVQLGPDDVPPGSVIRGAGEAEDPDHKGWCMITSSSLTGIRIWRHSEFHAVEITWRTLMEVGYQIWRPTDTCWNPCSKQEEVEP